MNEKPLGNAILLLIEGRRLPYVIASRPLVHTPADAKAVLQLTSSFMPSAGMLGAGAGEVNAAAA